MRIFLDLDGVLANFVKGACVLFGLNYEEVMSIWTPGEYDMTKILNITEEQFFEVIDAGGEKYWRDLPPYPYALDFYHYCKDIAPTYILTRPTAHGSSLSGKLQWMHKYFGSGFSNYVMTSKKELCAAPKTILIDDHVVNCTKFIDAGGSAFVWPAHNNFEHPKADKCVELAKEELQRWVREGR